MLHFNGPGEILVWAYWPYGDHHAGRQGPKLAEPRVGRPQKATDNIRLHSWHWNPETSRSRICSDVVEDINKAYPLASNCAGRCCISNNAPMTI